MSEQRLDPMTLFYLVTALIAEYNGHVKCFEKLQEEITELYEASAEWVMDFKDTRKKDHFLEELADVIILINETRHLLTKEQLAELGEICDFKARRTLRRMNLNRLQELGLEEHQVHFLNLMDRYELPLVPDWIDKTDKTERVNNE